MILRTLLEEKWEKVATEVENDNCILAELGSYGTSGWTYPKGLLNGVGLRRYGWILMV